MLRFVIRQLGLFVFAAGFIAFVSDGIASIAAEAIVVTPFREAWIATHAASLDTALGWIGATLGEPVRSAFSSAVLAAPAFAVAGVLGFLLMLAGRRRSARRARVMS
jgi:hypothetical protein